MEPTIKVEVWETRTVQQVADFIRQALKVREGEVLDARVIEDRANNIAQGLYGCAVVEGK